MSDVNPTTTDDEVFIDGADPAATEHLCARGEHGHEVVPGPVEACCADLWRAEGAAP